MNKDAHSKTQRRIVITGVNGFVGKHLTRELSKHTIEVIGIGREETVNPEIADLLSQYHVADLSEQWPEINNIDAVVHLAGLAAVGPSFEYPQDYINLNSAMVTNIAEYYLQQEKKPRLLVVSSGAIYSPKQAMPLTENSKVGFSSPYAVSKVLVENQCAYYKNRGLDCVVVRPFNHIGPGQGEGFLVPDVIKQMKKSTEITVGNIKTRRDYTDVRDIVRAYRLLAVTPNLEHSIYNACSGKSISGEEIIDTLKGLFGKPELSVIIDESKVRPTDPPDIFGSSVQLSEDTGWKPEITIESTLRDCLG